MFQPNAQERFGQLVTRVRSGDQEAWGEFHRIYEPKIRRVIRNRLRNINKKMRTVYDTCDFTNEFWEVMCVRLPCIQLQNEDDFIEFMSHVAWQKIIDASRKQTTLKRDSNRELSLYGHDPEDNVGLEPASHEPTPSQYAMAEETRSALERESEALDEDSALILRLKSQDYTNHEVAEATGIHLRKVQRLLKSLSSRFTHTR
jgi:RNA polymerase sigma factor (sigma-70 family)